ncbi:MAG: hypothetical protein J5658_02295 [Prevotella sp.]|nr:hypothetical protein [Prevotella sp.]
MKKLLLLAVCCIVLSNVNAQSEYKKWMQSEQKESTYSTKEIKKAAKEYTDIIYEEAKSGKIMEKRKDFLDKKLKKREDFILDEYARRVQDLRMKRYKVADNLPSLESQVKSDVRAEYAYETDLFPTNIPGEAKSLAKTYEQASNKAYDMARENLANEIVHEIMLQFIHKDFVKRFGSVKGQEMVQAILDTKSGILERIGDVEKVVELYNSKNTISSEVIVKVYYNGIQAKEDFKKALKDVLKNDETLYNEMTYFLDTVKAKK